MSKRLPRFSIQQDARKSADIINLPHEDYPYRIKATKEAIKMFPQAVLNKMIILGIHNHVMNDCDFRGRRRDIQVYVGEDTPPPPLLIDNLIHELLEDCYKPESGRDDHMKQRLMDFYYRFEKIHPFEDGNGRVG